MSTRLFTRMARRDAWRNGWRSLLMLAMVALPVAIVTAMDVVIKTAEVKPGESMSRVIGSADARVFDQGHAVAQLGVMWDAFIPLQEYGLPGSTRPPDSPAPDLGDVLGRPATALTVLDGKTIVDTDRGRVAASVVSTDFEDPKSVGLARLTEGRLPRGADEVAVNAALAAKGPGLSEQLSAAGRPVRVVGIMEDATKRSDPYVFAAPSNPWGDESQSRSWLVDVPGGVTWADTQKLNAAGFTVASALVAENPPSRAELPREFDGWHNSGQGQAMAVLVLVMTMVLIEVVLLAGPGFAVTARRRQRTLALLAVCGATPRQARRAMMASAWVMGIGAAVVGVVAGLAMGWLALRLGQPHYGEWFPPMQVVWLDVALVVVFGVLAALIAAWGPARLASQQDPVATLRGGRADPPAKLRSPILGLVLLLVGCATAVSGAKQAENGEITIAFSAVVCVLGMVLLLPVVLQWVGRIAGRLPLAGRYAVRDAARHRTRTVPAIAAVAATVAGAVALSISLSSDEAEAKATYQASYPIGTTVVSGIDGADVGMVTEQLAHSLPGVRGELVYGVPNTWHCYLSEGAPATGLNSWGGLGVTALAGNELPDFLNLSPAVKQASEAALQQGKVVIFGNQANRDAEAPIECMGMESEENRSVVAPAIVVDIGRSDFYLEMAIPPSVVHKLDLPTNAGSWVAANGGVSTEQQSDLEEVLNGLGNFLVQTERGYQADPAVRIIIWSLLGAAGLLMLAGTITSTLLSLADARRDLATLAAVGADPRGRRKVAAWYALVIAGIGAVAGTLVGLVPGIAVTVPLTASHPTLVIPWVNLALILVVLPVASALLMALLTRSRLPLLERAD